MTQQEWIAAILLIIFVLPEFWANMTEDLNKLRGDVNAKPHPHS